MAVDYVSFGGWTNNLRLANAHAELIITLDVGPRVISYRTPESENVFKIFDDQLGGTGEAKWLPRGGHRFWLAPEDPVLSYIPDNTPVEHRVLSDSEVQVTNTPNEQFPVRKTLRVALAADSSRVTVTHVAENCGGGPRTLATWGLSVMRPGGLAIIPLPVMGRWPDDLLPNRNLVLWPYTSMSDPRWNWGERFITLRQANDTPTKLGLLHREGIVGYHNCDAIFLKTVEFTESATYPDSGCNFETFTNEEMLEIEALGPLVSLAPGESTQHVEGWQLLPAVSPPQVDDAALAAWWRAFVVTR